MKKSITKILLLISLVVCVFSLAACGNVGPKPGTDLEYAARSLKSKGYTVVYNDEDSSALEAILNGANYEDFLVAYKEDKTVTMVVFETRKLARLYFDIMKYQNELTIQEMELELETLECKLDELKDELDSDEIEELEEEIEELKEEIEEYEDETAYGRKGKVVWFGSSDAIKDTK